MTLYVQLQVFALNEPYSHAHVCHFGRPIMARHELNKKKKIKNKFEYLRYEIKLSKTFSAA